MDVFLAQVLGVYFTIVGAIVLVRRKSIMPTISELAGNRALLFTIALLELVAGISMVLMYPNVGWTLPGFLSLIGWIIIVDSLFCLTSPWRYVQRFIKSFNKPGWYVGGGLLAIAMGLYLLSMGFGWM